MGKLRDQMVHDMDVRNFAPRTIESYVEGVRRLAKHYMKSPEELSDEEVQRFLLYIREECKLSASTCNQIRCALKFLYEVALRRPCAALTVPPMRMTQKLPEILSRQEVERIIDASATLRDRVLLMATYGGGLRVSEVVALRPGDIDQERGVVRVEQGKGRKDRYTPLAERLVSEIERYYRFLLHVVPKGFMRIRHYGITANCRRQQKLARCRELLSTTPVPSAATPLPAEAATAAATPEDTTLETTPRCPQCGASLRIIELLPPQPPDTS